MFSSSCFIQQLHALVFLFLRLFSFSLLLCFPEICPCPIHKSFLTFSPPLPPSSQKGVNTSLDLHGQHKICDSLHSYCVFRYRYIQTFKRKIGMNFLCDFLNSTIPISIDPTSSNQLVSSILEQTSGGTFVSAVVVVPVTFPWRMDDLKLLDRNSLVFVIL